MEKTKQIKYHVCDFWSYSLVLKVMGNGELCQSRWMFAKSAKIKLQEC